MATAAVETPTPTSAGSGRFEPAYLKLHRTGELAARAEKLWAIMESCRLCPRQCGVNRLEGRRGFCRAPGTTLVISAFHPHFGEEQPLVGRGGSGTIFLTHCNLRCVFCQNWEISHLGMGQESSVEEMADMMLQLQRMELPQHQSGDPDPLFGAHSEGSGHCGGAGAPVADCLQHQWLGASGDSGSAGRDCGHLPARLQVLGQRDGGEVLFQSCELPGGNQSCYPGDAPAGRSGETGTRWHYVQRADDPASGDAQ